MTRRGRVPLWAWLLYPASVLSVLIILAFAWAWSALQDDGRGNRMPNYSSYAVTGTSRMGDLSCGLAEMEVRSRGRQGEHVVVWRLDGKALAVVFVDDDGYVFFLDSDFDGWWDLLGGGPPGGGSATDFYAQVEGCEGLGALGE